MVKCFTSNYAKFTTFILLANQHDQFQAIIIKDQLLVRTLLQASLDVADTVTRSTFMAVSCREHPGSSCLDSQGRYKTRMRTFPSMASNCLLSPLMVCCVLISIPKPCCDLLGFTHLQTNKGWIGPRQLKDPACFILMIPKTMWTILERVKIP